MLPARALLDLERCGQKRCPRCSLAHPDHYRRLDGTLIRRYRCGALRPEECPGVEIRLRKRAAA